MLFLQVVFVSILKRAIYAPYSPSSIDVNEYVKKVACSWCQWLSAFHRHLISFVHSTIIIDIDERHDVADIPLKESD